MKKLLIGVGLFHLLSEGLVGLVMLFSPATVLPDVSAEALSFVRLYGGAAVAMSTAVLWAWPQRNNYGVMGVVLGLLASFHTALMVALLLAAATGGNPVFVGVVHGIIAALFWLLYARRAQWCTVPTH